MCAGCQLNRTNASRKMLLPRRKCQYVPDKYSSMVDEYEKRFVLFKGKFGLFDCELSLTDIDPIRKIYKDMCWAKVRDIRAIEYILGSGAVLLNLSVIVGTLLSQPLRRKTSFTLIAHLAFCDLLLGVYSISVATGHGIDDDPSFRRWRVSHCPYYRTVFILGQTMGVITSLLMTIDRYLAIVYCMKPSLRLTLKGSMIALSLSWFGTGILCYVIDYMDHHLIRDNFMCILVQNIQEDRRFLYSQALMMFCVILYLLVILMYIHIYVFVKRSAAKSGAHRETNMAARIAAIVMSNIIFFVVPNSFFVVFTAAMLNVSKKPIANALVRVWLPPVCMAISACINPTLFAFRNGQFTTEVKQTFHCLFWSREITITNRKRCDMTKQVGSQIVLAVSIELQNK